MNPKLSWSLQTAGWYFGLLFVFGYLLNPVWFLIFALPFIEWAIKKYKKA